MVSWQFPIINAISPNIFIEGIEERQVILASKMYFLWTNYTSAAEGTQLPITLHDIPEAQFSGLPTKMQYPYKDIINTELLADYFTDLKWQSNDKNTLRGVYWEQRGGRRIRHQGTCVVTEDCVLGTPPASLTGSLYVLKS